MRCHRTNVTDERERVEVVTFRLLPLSCNADLALNCMTYILKLCMRWIWGPSRVSAAIARRAAPQSHQLRQCGREGTLFNHVFAEAAPAAHPPSSKEFPAWMWRLLPLLNACRLSNITVHSTSGRVWAKKCGEKRINLRSLRNLRR